MRVRLGRSVGWKFTPGIVLGVFTDNHDAKEKDVFSKPGREEVWVWSVTTRVMLLMLEIEFMVTYAESTDTDLLNEWLTDTEKALEDE